MGFGGGVFGVGGGAMGAAGGPFNTVIGCVYEADGALWGGLIGG